MNFTNELSYMLKSGIGYRNTYCTSGVTKLLDIVKFEVIELCNNDIFYFMERNYDNYNFYSIHNKIDQIAEVLQFIAKLLNTNIDNLKGIWLTTYQNVLDKYCYDGEEKEFNNIVEVNIHEHKMIPISDLGKDGTLFAYTGDLDIANFNKEEEISMKTIIYPIFNWKKSSNYISGSDSIVYNRNKYSICAAYDKNDSKLKFVIVKPEKIKDCEKDNSGYNCLNVDLNNYWDQCVAYLEFKIVNINHNYDNDRDFFIDDIQTIRNYYERNFNRKFTNDYVYILGDNYYVANYEFDNDTDKILGIFIKKICKNLAYYLRILKDIYNDTDKLNASLYDTKSHKYLSDVFIGLRHGYDKDPDSMANEEYKEKDIALEKKFTDMGFISINDYTGFDGSHAFVFLNPTSNKELIHFYKMLYNDKRDIYKEIETRNT